MPLKMVCQPGFQLHLFQTFLPALRSLKLKLPEWSVNVRDMNTSAMHAPNLTSLDLAVFMTVAKEVLTNTVAFHSIQESRVTGPILILKCHGGHRSQTKFLKFLAKLENMPKSAENGLRFKGCYYKVKRAK
jgi:hypothetical protein